MCLRNDASIKGANQQKKFNPRLNLIDTLKFKFKPWPQTALTRFLLPEQEKKISAPSKFFQEKKLSPEVVVNFY